MLTMFQCTFRYAIAELTHNYVLTFGVGNYNHKPLTQLYPFGKIQKANSNYSFLFLFFKEFGDLESKYCKNV